MRSLTYLLTTSTLQLFVCPCTQSVAAISWVRWALEAAVTSRQASVAVNVTSLADSATSAWSVLLLIYCN